MQILLFNQKKDNIIEVKENTVLDELYNNLLMIPTEHQLKKHNKTIKKEYINEIRDYISKLDYKLPLFDYATKNIYLIEYSEIFNKVSIEHYRFPNNTIIDLLKTTILEMENIKITTEWIQKYIKKLKKNLNFLSNFNLQLL